METLLKNFLAEYAVYAVFLGIMAVAVFAHSSNRILRFLGLNGLRLLALAFFGAAALLLHRACAGPRFNEGIGNFAAFFFAFPLILLGYWTFSFYRYAKQYQAGESPYALTFRKLWQIILRLLGIN